jgi:hypothetical protein
MILSMHDERMMKKSLLCFYFEYNKNKHRKKEGIA